MAPKRLAKEDYTVGWICALSIPELKASRLLFDGSEHEDAILDQRTTHQYVYGEINGHNVVMGCLPASQMGKASAAAVANEMFTTFTGLHFGLIVGVGGGVPNPNDIRLGDVVVSLPDLSRQHGGVVQYDFGKAMDGGNFVKTGQLNQPSNTVLSGLGKLRSAPERNSNFGRYLELYKEDPYWDRGVNDRLFSAAYKHTEEQSSCSECDLKYEQARPERPTTTPRVHYGLIASGDQVMKDAPKRDALSQHYGGILCFEMEAAGIMNILPCLVVRGVCDYCDSHKNKSWQPFAAAAAAAWAKELLGNIAPVRSAGQALLRQGKQSNTAQDSWLEQFVAQLTTAKRSVDNVRDMINRISSYEPRQILKRTSRRKLPGTTEWLTNAAAFVDWESDSTSSDMLWLSGKGTNRGQIEPYVLLLTRSAVGSGKTIAMTTAVHHLLAKAQSQQNMKVMHHFFQYPETKAVDLFRSLLRQLLQFHMDHNQTCSAELVNDLDMHFGAPNRIPDLDGIIEDIMLPLTYAFDTLVVCIDGVDTSDAREQDDVCSGLLKLSQWRTKQEKRTRILITGENESKLGILLPADVLRIRLEHGFISDDINLYIDTRLQEQSHPRQLFHDTKLRARVKKALLQRAENMFLWVHLQLDEIIYNCTTAAEVDATLQDLPKTLQDLYMRYLKRGSDRKLLCNPKVLKWCSAAREPLYVDSLRDMLALELQSGKVNRSTRPDPESVIRSGVSLMILQEPEMLLEPAHRTVRQFIFSDLLCKSIAQDPDFPSAVRDQLNMSLDDSELEIAQLCLCHIKAKTRIGVDVNRTISVPQVIGMIPRSLQIGLRLGRQKKVVPNVLLPRSTQQDMSSFLQYAIKNWILHTRRIKKTTPSWNTFEYIALQPNASWRLHPWPAAGNTQTSHLRGLLGYAVAHKHQPLLQLLIDSPKLLPREVYDGTLPGNDLLPALHVAAESGHAELIPKLLKLCSVNGRCPRSHRTALHYAAARGHATVVKLLLEGQADVHAKDKAGRQTSLHLSAAYGHEDVVSTLLDSSQKEINSTDAAGKTPLHLAIYSNRYEGIVRQLLATGKADVNVRDSRGYTPLFKATMEGNTAVVRLLLADRETNVRYHNQGETTPLHVAAQKGYEDIVGLLLEVRGWYVGHRNANGEASYHLASFNGHDTLARRLLALANASDKQDLSLPEDWSEPFPIWLFLHEDARRWQDQHQSVP